MEALLLVAHAPTSSVIFVDETCSVVRLYRQTCKSVHGSILLQVVCCKQFSLSRHEKGVALYVSLFYRQTIITHRILMFHY